MSDIIKYSQVEDKIITLRNKPVLLDSDVAELYGVETREINQAVRNNPKKFPAGYIFEVDDDEYNFLRSKILTLEKTGRGQHTKYLPKAFTERGLYMLATILKGDRAIKTTLTIIDTFARLRELTRAISELNETQDEPKQKSLLQKTGELLTDLLDDEMQITDKETTLELNLAMVKVKHTIKSKKKQ